MTLHLAVGGLHSKYNLIDAYNFPRRKGKGVLTKGKFFKVFGNAMNNYAIGNDCVPILYVVSDAAGMFELVFLAHLG